MERRVSRVGPRGYVESPPQWNCCNYRICSETSLILYLENDTHSDPMAEFSWALVQRIGSFPVRLDNG